MPNCKDAVSIHRSNRPFEALFEKWIILDCFEQVLMGQISIRCVEQDKNDVILLFLGERLGKIIWLQQRHQHITSVRIPYI